MSDSDEQEFDTLGEALRHAFAGAPADYMIDIHDGECPYDGEDESLCVCEPLEISAGSLTAEAQA
jgi:hypothetical protein